MRKLAFLALAMAAVGCSTGTTDSSVSSEVAAPAVGDPGVSAAQVRAFEKLQLDTGSTWTWMQHETHGTPSHLSVPRSRTGKALLVSGRTAERTTIELVDQYRDLFKMTDAAAELSVSRSEVDPDAAPPRAAHGSSP